MIILGVDVSTKTGLCTIKAEQNTAKVLKANETFTPKDMVGLERASHIAEQMIAHIEEHKPGLVVFEDYAYANQHTLTILVEIGTILRYFVRQFEITAIYVSPTMLKKFITGDGTSSKNHMGTNVYKKWGFEHPSDNVIDAYALAKVGQGYIGLMTLTDYQKKALAKISPV